MPILNVLTPDKIAFLGFDSILQTGVYISYLQDKIFHFSFDDILGCNWTENKHTVKFEISLKKEKLKRSKKKYRSVLGPELVCLEFRAPNRRDSKKIMDSIKNNKKEKKEKNPKL